MSKEIVVIKAAWCGPCKAYAPKLEEAKQTFNSKGYDLRFVDADENPEFCQKHNVRGVPTTLVMDGERVFATWVGATPIDEIVNSLF
jgi:thiol-disulfide isomerase/thioredoxin